jgi:methylisocitrate lyase
MEELMSEISRRNFGKSMAMGAIGGLAAAGKAAPPARGTGPEPRNMGAALRELLNGPGIFPSPGVYDPMTAKLAELAGFRLLDLAGSALGYVTTMMEPNLTIEDMAEAARAITGAVNIPLIIDAGAGFGEPAHVFHAIRVFEHAGAAGVHIEDQVFPKRFHYHVGIEQIISAEEMVDKIHAACEARRDPNTVICGRTDAIKTDGYKEGVRRANMYFEAGVDLMMIFPSTPEEVVQIVKDVHGPINSVQSFRPDKPKEVSMKYLESLGGYAPGKGGYKIVNYPGHAILKHYEAVKAEFKYLHEHGESGMDKQKYQDITHDLWKDIDYQGWNKIESETTEKPKS